MPSENLPRMDFGKLKLVALGIFSNAWEEGILEIMFNKTFYKFFFGFLAIIASTLILILIIGGEAQ